MKHRRQLCHDIDSEQISTHEVAYCSTRALTSSGFQTQIKQKIDSLRSSALCAKQFSQIRLWQTLFNQMLCAIFSGLTLNRLETFLIDPLISSIIIRFRKNYLPQMHVFCFEPSRTS